MPNRIIKESVRTSPSLAALSDAAERLWHRLVTCVDDFGRYDGDPEVILAGCFGRRPKGWNAGKIERCLQELSTEPNPKDRPLLYRYDIKGRWYVEITKAELHLTRRAKVSKWPSRPTGANLLASANKCLQPRANAPLNESESENENGNESENGNGSVHAPVRTKKGGEECPPEVREKLARIGVKVSA